MRISLLLFLLFMTAMLTLPLILVNLHSEEDFIEITYSTECKPTYIKPKAIYFKSNKTLQIFINKNCCNTSLSVEAFDDTIYVKEIKNGIICKCFCTAIINIISNKQWKNIYFEDFTGKRIKINITYK